MAADGLQWNTDRLFYHIALQYYAAGRFAALAGLMPVSGNLAHHAVEMMLKGRLTNAFSLEQLARKPYSHNLPRIWNEFVAQFPNEDLTRFSPFSELLHDFDSIRYPDDILRKGAHITVGFVTQEHMRAPGPTPPNRSTSCQLPIWTN